MYESTEDPYCYPGTAVLRNVPGLIEPEALAAFEAMATAQRADEPLPQGELDVPHYKKIHRHLFQDVYQWSGEFRTVRIGKDGSGFCYPEHIAAQMEELFHGLKEDQFFQGLNRDAFVDKAAVFLSHLNAIHPFREGNGRTQNLFLHVLATQAGHPFDLNKLDATEFLAAMVQSFHGDNNALRASIYELVS